MLDDASGEWLGTRLIRFTAVALLAVWQGGFTFYGAVVIRVAERVLGSHLPVGFITQRVSNWLNLIGGATLGILLWNLSAIWQSTGSNLRRTLAGSWVVMAVTVAGLIVMHPFLDRVLDAQVRQIINPRQFRLLHRVYLIICTIQWSAAVVHLWCLMRVGEPAVTNTPALREAA